MTTQYNLKCYNNNANVDIMTLRRFVHGMFTEQEQQDAPEFICYLVSKLEKLRLFIEHELGSKFVCSNNQCSQIISTNIESNIIILLTLPQYKSKCTLQELIRANFETPTMSDVKCKICDESERKESKLYEIINFTTNNEIILMQLNLFHYNGNEFVKTNNFIITDVLSYVHIDNKVYFISSIIVHQGSTKKMGIISISCDKVNDGSMLTMR